MSTKCFTSSLTVAVAVLSGMFSVYANAAPPDLPDFADYAPVSASDYQRNGATQFRTPDGLLCHLANQMNIEFWCSGPLPDVPKGVNVVSASGEVTLQRWESLPPGADRNAPVLPPKHSISAPVPGGQSVTCIVDGSGMTACRANFGAYHNLDMGFVLSAAGTRLWYEQ